MEQIYKRLQNVFLLSTAAVTVSSELYKGFLFPYSRKVSKCNAMSRDGRYAT